MNTRTIALIGALCCLQPVLSSAQGTVGELQSEFRGRIYVDADHKLAKGLHLGIEGELRFNDNFSSFSRFQTGAGITYKVNPWLKVGGGYTFIGKINSSGELKPRHRIYADAKGTLKYGLWNISLKERLQLTHRSVKNQYSSTPNALMLKSRLKVVYKGLGSISPYAFAEARLFMNAPSCSAVWDAEDEEYYNYEFLGYTDTYFNRLRGGLGAEWKLDKKKAFDFFVLTDYCYDKKVKTSSSLAGISLESLVYKQHLNCTLGVGYKFSF